MVQDSWDFTDENYKRVRASTTTYYGSGSIYLSHHCTRSLIFIPVVQFRWS